MISAFVASLALLQIEQTPRLKETLPSGTYTYIERIASPGRISVVMAASLAGVEQSPETHGYIHLVEHLAARGRAKDVDVKLESQGMMLTATTTRDAMIFQIDGRTSQLNLALEALKEIASPAAEWTAEEIAAEVKTMAEERALQSNRDLLTSSAWSLAFGPQGMDTFGDLAAMAAATPEKLKLTHAQIFSGSGLSIAVVGDIQVRDAQTSLAAAFGSAPAKGEPRQVPIRSVSEDKAGVNLRATGELRSAVIEGIDDVTGLAALQAAFAISSEIEGAEPVLTPSTWRGVISIRASKEGSFAAFDRMSEEELASYFTMGQTLAIAWLKQQTADPSSLAKLMAVISWQNRALNPEVMRDRLIVVNQQQFINAMKKFQEDQAIIVKGGAE